MRIQITNHDANLKEFAPYPRRAAEPLGAIRRLEEILAEEDDAGLVRSNDEWLERFHDAVRDDALIAEFGT